MSRLWIIVLVPFVACSGCGGSGGEGDHKDHAHLEHHDHDHDHTGPNAHLWLDPVLTRQFVEAVAGPLAESVAAANDRKARVVVSIPPLASLLTDLLGDGATITTMLPQGGSPHGYELTPDVLKALSHADVLVMVGLTLDPWAEKAAKNVGSKGLRVLKFAELVHDHQEGHVKPMPNDHPLATNVRAITARLDALHEEYKTELAKVKTKELITFHNAFDLLAARYGLKVVAHLTEMDLPTGAEVTPGALREVRDAVKKHGLKSLYAEPQYPDAAMQAIAEATGVKVLRLDDLGGPDRQGYRTYFEMMESNLKVLVEGQSR
jgi:zinc transport system substrate-binding protein